jgi:hypothetical protein
MAGLPCILPRSSGGQFPPFHDLVMRPLPSAIFIVPIVVLGIGLLPMTYGFYTLLRLVVFVCGGLITYRHYKEGQANSAIIFGIVTLAYNPLIPVFLSRLIWLPIDLVVIWLFWKAKERNKAGSVLC